MLSLAAIKLLRDKGLTLDDVIEVAEACGETARSSGAARQARYRERQKASDVTGDVTGDVTSPAPNEKNPPHPQETLTPSPKENPPKGGQKKGTRLPDDWQPSDDLRAYAARQGITGDWLAREAEKFRNWAHTTPGQKAVKLNWDKAFQNWCLTAAERGPPKVPATGPPNGHAPMTEEEKAQFRAEMREKMRREREARDACTTH